MERNIIELKQICIDYYKQFNTSSGLNNRLSQSEIILLLKDTNAKKLSECVHILVYGYVGICKICNKRTEYLGKTLLYRKYCCHKCSTLDKEERSNSSKKGVDTKKKNNIKPKVNKTIIYCKECGCEIEVSWRKRNYHKGYCDKHKKECKYCGKRHGNAGVCCSIACSKELKKATNMKNFGVEYNLLCSGVRKNQIEYYLKQGYSYEESTKMTSEYRQINYNNISNTTENKLKSIYTKVGADNIDGYLIHVLDKIKNYNFKELYKPYKLIKLNCSHVIFEKYSIKYIYNKLYKIDNNLFKYERVTFKRNRYGYISYTKDGQILRSKLEYDFYRLLETNNIINYKIGKKYPDSKYYYDFYLEDFNIYIEIAGLMKFDDYAKKMTYKQNIFENVVILQNCQEMIAFIEKIKKHENKKNN